MTVSPSLRHHHLLLLLLLQARLGADVTATDLPTIVPDLLANLRNNVNAATMGEDITQCGPFRTAPLDWTDHSSSPVFPSAPFDLVVGTDCVYAAHLVEPLFHTILAAANQTSTVILCHEKRDITVHESFLKRFKSAFTLRPVKLKDQDPQFSHVDNEIWILKPT